MSVRVKDHPGLVRDPYSKAVINSDSKNFNTYLEQRERMRKQQETIEKNDAEIAALKDDMAEIKSLLKELLGRGK